MSNRQLDAIHAELAESARKAAGEPELTPEEKINAGFKANEDKAVADLTAEVDGLSQIAAKAMTYKAGNNAACWHEFGRGEKNKKTIKDLGAKYFPVRNEVILKYQGHILSHEGRAFLERVKSHLASLDKAFED